MINKLKENGHGYKNSQGLNLLVIKNGGFNMETKISKLHMEYETGQILFRAYMEKENGKERRVNETALLKGINEKLAEKKHYENVFRVSYTCLNMENRIYESIHLHIAGPHVSNDWVENIYLPLIEKVYGNGFKLSSVGLNMADKEAVKGVYTWDYGKENVGYFEKAFYLVFIERDINKAGIFEDVKVKEGI